jgi:ketosteroid isomerase-like protein
MSLRTLLVGIALLVAACDRPRSDRPSLAEREAIAETLTRRMAEAYDFSRPGARERLLSLYPDSGRVISAAAGRVTSSRAELDSAIGTFWEYVGQNMRDPRWIWGDVHVDVLSANAAVVTASYTIPHHTPAGRPHTIAGAWTAVFERRHGAWVVVQEHLSDVPVSADTAAGAHH